MTRPDPKGHPEPAWVATPWAHVSRSTRLLSLIALVLLAVVLTAPSAGAEPGFQRVVSVPLPTGTKAPYFAYQSIACVSVGTCTAIGSEFDEPFVIEQTSGTWGTPQLLDGYMTGGYDTTGPMHLSCPVVEACVAVGGEESGGDYGPGSTPIVEYPYVVTESGGIWGKIQFLTPPPDASATTPLAAFTSVWCSSPGYCVAVGQYSTSTGTTRAMQATETGGVWGSTTALPGSESFGRGVYFSCSSSGNCAAASDEAAWIENGGVWGSPTAFGQGAGLTVPFQPLGLGCTTTACVAIGATFDGSAIFAGSDVETNGSWGAATTLPAPALSPAETRSSFTSISCQSSSCVAVGSGGGTSVPSPYSDPISATWTTSGWSSIGIDQVGVRNAYDDSFFQSVSCPPTAACEAVGQLATFVPPGYPTGISQVDTVIQPVEPVVSPGPPTTVTAYPAVDSVEVTWTPPTEDGGAAIASYTATLSPGGATCRNTAPFCMFPAVNGRQYVVAVHDSNGTVTSTAQTLSNHVFAGLVPSTPTNLRAVRFRSGEFAWSASTSPAGETVLRYRVSATGDGRTLRCSSLHTSCVDHGLTGGVTYAVSVSSFDVTGWSGPSVTVTYRPAHAT